jgi:predicted  nucleic acid-binding Zn-ribbon protein
MCYNFVTSADYSFMSSLNAGGQDLDPLVALGEEIREVKNEKKELMKKIKEFEDDEAEKNERSEKSYIEDKKRLTALEIRLGGLEARRERLEAQAYAAFRPGV